MATLVNVVDPFGRQEGEVSWPGQFDHCLRIEVIAQDTSSEIAVKLTDMDSGATVQLSDRQIVFLVKKLFEPPISSYDKRFEIITWVKKLAHNNKNFFQERRTNHGR